MLIEEAFFFKSSAADNIGAETAPKHAPWKTGFNWSAAGPTCFTCSQRMPSSPAALLIFIYLIAPHRLFMLNCLVKYDGPRGEHERLFGRLTLLEWWSGFPRLFTRSW